VSDDESCYALAPEAGINPEAYRELCGDPSQWGGCYASSLYGGGYCGGPDPDPTPPPPPPPPSCDDLLAASLNAFLKGKGSSLSDYVSNLIDVGRADNIDPRLFAAMAIAENGQSKNNPFGLGPNGHSRFDSLSDAIDEVGSTLYKYINTRHETTVSALWSGNKWIEKPPGHIIQQPGYCVALKPEDVAGCQKTGRTISGFMQSMGGDPNNLAFPCKDDN
jgi:hypothetical protein